MKTLLMLFFTPVLAFAEIDRRPMVAAAHGIFPQFVRIVAGGKALDELAKEERAIFRQVEDLVKTHTVPLVFDPDPTHFDLTKGEWRRWMRTPINAPGEIDVNLALLQAPDVEITIPLLLKILFHEWLNKTGVKESDLRDRVAQFFERQASLYTREFRLDETSKLHVFSVPLHSVEEELVPAGEKRPQPTNIVLYERDGVIFDLTESVLVSLEQPISMLRSIWTEANRVIYEIYRGMGHAISSAMSPIVQQMNAFVSQWGVKGVDTEDMQRGLLFNLSELRMLEIDDAEAVDTGQQFFVRLKATWQFSRTHMNGMTITVDGFDFSDTYPIPLTIWLKLPKRSDPSASDVESMTRPHADPLASARVHAVHRASDGRVHRLRVSFEAPRRPGTVILSTAYNQGLRTLVQKSVEPGRAANQWIAEFEPAWRFLPADTPLVAESLLLDGVTSIYLDRLVELNTAGSAAPPEVPPNQLIPDSVFLRGLQDGEKTERNEFPQPVHMVDHLASDRFSLNPSNIRLRFDLREPAQVREVRLHMKRSMALLDNDKGEHKSAETKWDGESRRLLTGGKLIKKADVHEILVAGSDQIYRTENADGSQRTITSLKAPWLQAGEPACDSQGHCIPLVVPVLVEIVLEGGQTLRHEFGPGLECTANLRPTGEGS